MAEAIAASTRGKLVLLMREFIGINGHTVNFKPELYQPVCRLVRDYHPVEWDLGKNTSELPPFPTAKNGVDWDQVYGSWARERLGHRRVPDVGNDQGAGLEGP